jgi:transposase
MGEARYVTADRRQLRWEMLDLEGLLPADHPVRVVWSFAAGLNLRALYEGIGARDGEPGRPPADPRIMVSLWHYATLQGVGSARHLARLCDTDLAYRWLCGGVAMNYHGLSDFRVAHGAVLDTVLTQSLAALMAEGVVVLDEVALDGTKVRASAGRGSFHRGGTLAAQEALARRRVAALKDELGADPAASSRREVAGRKRAAEDVARRAAAAQKALAALQEEKAKRAVRDKSAAKAPEPKASLTDADARIMRFADGAVRAGYNIQFGVEPGSGIIVAAQATNRRNDMGLAQPMVAEVERRCGRAPRRVLADTTYATQDDIVALAKAHIEVYAPPQPDRPSANAESCRKRAWRHRNEPEAVRQWRARMAGAAGQEIYCRRRWVETINGITKQRGLALLRVRTLAKVTCIALWHAIAHNLWRAHVLHSAAVS